MSDFNLNEPHGDDETSKPGAIISQLQGGSAEGGEFDLTMASPPKKALPLQAISVGLVLVVGAGALFLMRRHGTRAGIDFTNTSIVVNAADTTVKKFENEEQILEALQSTGALEQVPRDQVRDDVFLIDKLGGETGGGPASFVDPSKAAAERRRVAIQETLGRLQVESVMNGRVPIAKISGKLYRVGDTVEEFFEVARIEDRSVFLAVDNKEYELVMVN